MGSGQPSEMCKRLGVFLLAPNSSQAVLHFPSRQNLVGQQGQFGQRADAESGYYNLRNKNPLLRILSQPMWMSMHHIHRIPFKHVYIHLVLVTCLLRALFFKASLYQEKIGHMGSTQCQGLSSHVNKSHMGSIEFVLIIEKITHMGCISIPLAHVIMFPLQSLLLFLTLPPCSPKVSQSCCNYFLQISFFDFFFFFSSPGGL